MRGGGHTFCEPHDRARSYNPADSIPSADNGEHLVVDHAWYGDVIGGSFRLASEFAEDLAAAGHWVDYVCCAPDDRPDGPACSKSAA